ncbi:MAG: hypothetical protein ACTHJY_14005 [Rhizobiaceae bacterium]
MSAWNSARSSLPSSLVSPRGAAIAGVVASRTASSIWQDVDLMSIGHPFGFALMSSLERGGNEFPSRKAMRFSGLFAIEAVGRSFG